jgi:hypothetical protein
MRMSPNPSPAAAPEGAPPHLSPFETAFVRTVLDHRGIGARPSIADLMGAFDLLRRYGQQCVDNPRDADSWEPTLNDERLAEMRAKAFIMFGATKPTPAQWHKVHAALYGALAPGAMSAR